jgi:molecular chaperone IbpA
MKTIDLTPLYRNSIGYDRLASLLDTAFRSDTTTSGYPPYDIEMVDDNHYAITLAVAGFAESELSINVERGVLTVRGEKSPGEEEHKYLYHGIAARGFERKFNLAEYVEVTGARLDNGLLKIGLVREIPEAMKPKSITINSGTRAINQQPEKIRSEKSDSVKVA